LTVPSPSNISKDYFIERIQENYIASDPTQWDIKWQLSDATQYYFAPSAIDITLPITGQGAYYQFHVSGAATNWQAVYVPGDSKYVYIIWQSESPGTWYKDTYTIQVSDYQSGTINSVTMYYRVALSDTADKAHRVIRIGSNNYNGDDKNQTGFHTYSDILTVSPATGLAWTWSEINSMQVGVEMQGNSALFIERCSYIYIVVNVTPSW
jgi:hypothetical protein